MGSRPTPDQPVVRETLMDVRLPATTHLDRIEVRRIRMLPSHPAGLHVHNGPVVGSIVEGSVVYQIDGEPPSVLGPGEVFTSRRAHASPDSTPARTASRSWPTSRCVLGKSRASTSRTAEDPDDDEYLRDPWAGPTHACAPQAPRLTTAFAWRRHSATEAARCSCCCCLGRQGGLSPELASCSPTLRRFKSAPTAAPPRPARLRDLHCDP
jgi:hypothetical protein